MSIEIEEKIDALKALLLRKNAAYGDFYKQPGILSYSSPEDRMSSRIDEKLARLKNLWGGTGERGEALEDTCMDLAGCFVLMTILLEAAE